MKSVNKIFTIEELKKEVAVLAERYKIDSVYLFGSYARGNDEREAADCMKYDGQYIYY